MPASWNTQPPLLDNKALVDWLLDPQSLTARLKQHCDVFRVEVLGQEIKACTQQESCADIHEGEDVLVREVLLYCDNKPHVFARSLLPLRSLTGNEKQLAELGNESLGQVLFNHPNLTRKEIATAKFDFTSSVAKLITYFEMNVEQSLWGRRSIFMVDEKPLMVAEIFLPNAVAYHNETVKDV